MLPDSKKDLNTKEAVGLRGREQKEKSGLPRPSYLGSLNGFQIKAKGLPWTHSRRGCFPGNLPALTAGAEPGSLPSPLSWWLGSHSQHKQTLAAPLRVLAPSTCKDRTPRQGPELSGSRQGTSRTAVNRLASPCLLRGSGV